MRRNYWAALENAGYIVERLFCDFSLFRLSGSVASLRVFGHAW